MIPKKKFRNSENGKYKKKKEKREISVKLHRSYKKKKTRKGNHTCIKFETKNTHHEAEK